MRDAEGKEKDFVTIKSSADQTTFSLFSSEPNKEGVELTGIEWSDQVGKSKVMLKKGSDFETLLFDQANLRTQPTVPNGVPPRPGSPGVPPPRMGGTVMPNNVQPMIGGQKPRIQPIVPRPNSVPPGINQPQPQAVPKAGAVGPGASPGPSSDQRKRIRVINSNPGGI